MYSRHMQRELLTIGNRCHDRPVLEFRPHISGNLKIKSNINVAFSTQIYMLLKQIIKGKSQQQKCKITG